MYQYNYWGDYLLYDVLCRKDELEAGKSALQLKEKLLEKEKDILVTQNDWLTQELEGKTEKLNDLLKERSTTVGELESQNATKDEEVRFVLIVSN